MDDLIIDAELKRLAFPLSSREYQKVKNGLLGGKTAMVVAWNNYIIDGFEEYEICKEYDVDCEVMNADFPTKEAVIVFICKHQLRRKDLPDPMRHYLIGKQYEAEKAINQTCGEDEAEENGTIFYRAKKGSPKAKHRVALRIGEANNISHATVAKYAEFVNRIDIIFEKAPDFVPNVLNGKYKVSHQNIVDIAALSTEDIRRVEERIVKEQEPYIKYHDAMHAVRQTRENGSYSHFERTVPSVKDMPKFDPDAELTGLSLTVPSWISSIERVMKNSRFDLASDKAKLKLHEALFLLTETIKDLDTKL